MKTKFVFCFSSGIDDYINSEDDSKELKIERCNAFIRRIIHQEVRLRWPNKVRLETRNENGGQHIVVCKVGTKEEEEQKEAERKEKEKLEFQEAVGLSALLRKIADSVRSHLINSFTKYMHNLIYLSYF